MKIDESLKDNYFKNEENCVIAMVMQETGNEMLRKNHKICILN